VLTYNPLRVAEVWMDDYRFLYYDRFGRWDRPLAQRLGHFGDVSERRALRKRLECQPFQWYLDNVAVDMPQHQLLGSGEIFNLATKLCLDQTDKPKDIGKVVAPVLCHMAGGNQYWMFRTDGKILRDYLCIGLQGEQVAVVPCEETVRWDYEPDTKLLTYRETGGCLELRPVDGRDVLALGACDAGSALQQWHFTHYNPGGMHYRDLA
jgi:polypeptide N-acetylgalactosaminyltransferase